MPTMTAKFFLIALGFTWALQAPLFLAQRGLIGASADQMMGLAGLGTFGPLIAALVVSRSDPGGLRGFFKRVVTLGTTWQWALLALLAFPLLYLAGRAVAAPFHVDARWLYLPENSQHIAALIMIPIVEELGWRGTALPRLQRRYGARKATALLGLGWAAWHLFMFLSVTSSPLEFMLAMINIGVGSVVFSWMFNKTAGSIPIALLLHAGAHLNNPAHVTGNLAPMALYTAAIAVVAVVMLADRARWPGPERALP